MEPSVTAGFEDRHSVAELIEDMSVRKGRMRFSKKRFLEECLQVHRDGGSHYKAGQSERIVAGLSILEPTHCRGGHWMDHGAINGQIHVDH